MGEVVDLAERRNNQKIHFTFDNSLCVIQSGPVEVHGYSFWQCAAELLNLLQSGCTIVGDKVILKVIPRPRQNPQNLLSLQNYW